MNTFSIGESVKFGWETFKKRPWFFMGVSLCVFVVYSILSAVTDEKVHDTSAAQLLVSIAAGVIGIFVEMMLVNIALKSHDSVETVAFSDAWAKKPFWSYLGVKILNGIVVVVGLILLIVPGVIAALTLLFGNYLVVDKGLGPIQAMKESARITKGHRWQLFGFVLVLVGLNILGLLALFVGLLVTIPVTILAMAHVYRTLEHKASELTPSATS